MANKKNVVPEKAVARKKRIFLLAGALVLLCACGDGGEPAQPEKAAAAAPGTGSVERCLADNSKTPCNILDGKIAASFAPGDAQLTTESREFAGQVSCRIHWNGGRTMAIGAARALTVPASDELVFGAVSRETAGVDEAARRFTEHYLPAPQTGQKDRTAAESEAGAIDAAQIAAVRFEPVADLGDAAAWGGTARVKSLWVRVGASRFEVAANLSDSPAENRDSSIRLARRVIGYCE